MPAPQVRATILITLALSSCTPALVAGAEPRTAFPRDPKARLDRCGDPLPEGALARLGTVRFRHPGVVHAVAFSPDGKLIAAASDGESMVVLWDRATGHKLQQITLAGLLIPPGCLRFSANGKRLYGSSRYSQPDQVYAWDVQTGKDTRDVPRLPQQARALGYSPDGREVLLLDQKRDVVRWDVEAGKERGRYPKPGGDFCTAALVDRQLLVAAFDHRSVALWDAGRQKQLWSVPATREYNRPGLPMVFSADGKLFATETPPRVISVYESVTGKKVRQIKASVKDIFWSLSFSPDARILAGSSWDGTLLLWDLESGKERIKLSHIERWITEVFFAPDSRTFATGSLAHGVLLWDTATGQRIDSFPGHTSPLSGIALSPDGQKVATCSSVCGDSVVRLWEVRTGRLLQALETSMPRGVNTVAFSPDGQTLATGSGYGGGQVSLWDIGTGRLRQTLAGAGPIGMCVTFSPDGKQLASGSMSYNRKGKWEGWLCVWDVARGKQVRRMQLPRRVDRILFHRGGRQMLVAANGVHVLDVDSGQPAPEMREGGRGACDLALSADGRLLATADGSRVRLWEMATRREIPLPAFPSHSVALSPDGRTLAARGTDGGLLLFDWLSGQVVASLPGAPPDSYMLAVFSSHGRRILTANSFESSALVWDVAGAAKGPLPAVANPTRADLHRWWSELRDDSPKVGYRAIWRLVATGEQALAFLADSLQPIKPIDPRRVARLIDDLDNDDFQTRERALRELDQLGEAVVDKLRKALQAGPSLEQVRRIRKLLGQLAGPVPSKEQLRAVRAVSILEHIGGAQAQKVLTRLAAGAAGARLTEEARAALERMKQAQR
jgi:WD40 repeat protein